MERLPLPLSFATAGISVLAITSAFEQVRAQQTATDISQLDHRVDQQETVFNAQLTAITARLNLIQESLNERLYKIEGVQHLF